jgi:hypothetical protein
VGYFCLMSARTCRGCGKPTPEGDADALTRWAVVNQVDKELYCPDCLTPGEADCLSTVAEQMVEDQLLLDRLPGAGRGVFIPEQRTGDAQPAVADQPAT